MILFRDEYICIQILDLSNRFSQNLRHFRYCYSTVWCKTRKFAFLITCSCTSHWPRDQTQHPKKCVRLKLLVLVPASKALPAALAPDLPDQILSKIQSHLLPRPHTLSLTSPQSMLSQTCVRLNKLFIEHFRKLNLQHPILSTYLASWLAPLQKATCQAALLCLALPDLHTLSLRATPPPTNLSRSLNTLCVSPLSMPAPPPRRYRLAAVHRPNLLYTKQNSLRRSPTCGNDA